ncbi:succinyl-diaminopimelate desuccinylase [Breoghania sp.]|uniref:succinyl-diaminopimelate desuccinylase n=1 Tax=Breoghania sp. TaxID=2065378 RepID=UPI00262F2374|nr:succinyl-diaminopimelate desuccinylase [Breoghania sp.]MDJ0930967.1 succinyl-diaminopimelate desuccinylase [Breoghania sp.]
MSAPSTDAVSNDRNLSAPVQITRDLVRCPSVTPQEGGALAYLAGILEAAGFEVHRVTFSAPGTPDVENLFAKIGSGAPHVAFAGHTDVVPPGDEGSWDHAPFSGEIADGVLYGRGTVDMKGGVAAFAAAALDYLADETNELPGTISFLITGDEEGPAVNGTVRLMEWCKERGERFDACIVGEPTNPNHLGEAIKVGRRGSLTGTITVTGKQGHVAYPHLAENPIPGMMRLYGALNELVLDEGNDRFQPSNLEFVTIDTGNLATNVIPEKVQARFNVRFNDTWSRETLSRRLEEVLREVAGNTVRYTLEFREDGSDSCLTNDKTLIETLSAAVEAEIGRKPELSTGGGTSDARFIKNYCPVVEFGLVGQTMHQVNEHVSVEDLEKLASIYRRFLSDYFKA